MSSIAIARGVSFEFTNGRCLFHNLNFIVEDKLSALVGPNGIGKTLLAKLLAGEIEPTSGTLRRHSTISLFPQRETPEPITVAEYLSSKYEWSLSGERLLQNVDRMSLCTMLSGGQWMRVRLARAPADDFLILDEPTNDLDRDGRRAVLEFLRERNIGALLISHDRECLELCEDVFELSQRGIARFGDGWSNYLDEKTKERARLAAALDVARRERDAVLVHRVEQRSRQEKRNRRGARDSARGGMPKILAGARKRRSQQTMSKLDVSTLDQANAAIREAHMALSEMKVDPIIYANITGEPLPAQKLVAEARAFNICFHDWIYARDLDFTWRGNVRVSLRGGNGSGKSTLLRALTGSEFMSRGGLRLGHLTSIYLDQRCDFPDEDKSLLDTLRAVSVGTESEVRNALAKFLFAADDVHRKVRDLSGGERLRAALAVGLLRSHRPELLVLDEPTSSLDLANVEFLENIVRKFRGALIIVSHDESFLTNCAVTEELVLAEC